MSWHLSKSCQRALTCGQITAPFVIRIAHRTACLMQIMSVASRVRGSVENVVWMSAFALGWALSWAALSWAPLYKVGDSGFGRAGECGWCMQRLQKVDREKKSVKSEVGAERGGGSGVGVQQGGGVWGTGT